ncbi:MAG: hypothetical protein IJU50_04445 [Lachnospiraceae bacterium]|nr:hypothetical protein [Lachnospiraceae bacterium]
MRRIIIFIVIGVIAILGVLGVFLQQRFTRIPANPPAYVGNTPGNINHGL